MCVLHLHFGSLKKQKNNNNNKTESKGDQKLINYTPLSMPPAHPSLYTPNISLIRIQSLLLTPTINHNYKKGKNKVYCGMALLLTVSRGHQSPCELLRCGWHRWRPGGSEQRAAPSAWRLDSSPWALHGPSRPLGVTSFVSAACPGTWCWCSARGSPSC